MARVDRFSVSLDTELLAAFDRHITDRGYGTRSEAIRDLIRSLLTETRLPQNHEEALAVLTIVCDHRVHRSAKSVRDLLASTPDLVAGSMLAPIDEQRDALTITLKGSAPAVQTLADKIQAIKGITEGHLWVVPSQI